MFLNMANKKRNFLVIGGAGYIGSHMVIALEDLGHKVTIFDNFSRGAFRGSNITNIIEGSLLNISDLNDCFQNNKFDLVMHFAAFAYVGESVRKPLEYFENNVSGTINLLKSMKQSSHNKLVFSSTCAIYGEPKYVPIDENHPKEPVNPYGKTKLFMEQLLDDFSKSNDFRSISLRYFNAAGCDKNLRTGEEHNPETHLIPLVLKQAKLQKSSNKKINKTLDVFGDDFNTIDGTCIRDYIHVSDICDAHLLAAERIFNSSGSLYEAYNLASDKGSSVLDVIKACSKITNTDIKYSIKNRRPGDPAELIGDPSRAKKILGWNPKYPTLDSIIPSAWKWENKT
jgi:UDP-glucose 4-epimerase